MAAFILSTFSVRGVELSRRVYRFLGNSPTGSGTRNAWETTMKHFAFIALGWLAAGSTLALIA
ncbi:hypothetical protein GQE99_13510 [Maritimibacter sp. DP07]|uniref:Uncharacterized protein n=1 Tax=Maritimibacter harenae TaxID=2606218 RepID=A0A845MA60_9RHOB|nr:hypothetical protein [Maritimibacter harenae]MZR14034.1 hypothetical protein [Maritimibacter harenae]